MKTLLTMLSAYRVTLLEVGGAAAIVGGVAAQWGAPFGWMAVGAAGLVKAFELDLLDRPRGDE